MKQETINMIFGLMQAGRLDTVQAILSRYELKGENQNETLQKSKSDDHANSKSPTAPDNPAFSLPDNLPPNTIAVKPEDAGRWCVAHYTGKGPHPFVVHTMDKDGFLFWGKYLKTYEAALEYFNDFD